MSTTRKKRESSDEDELRKRIKELESTNRVLRKRLKKLEGYHQQKEDLVIEAEINEEIAELTDERKQYAKTNAVPTCPECEGMITVVKTAGRMFTRCGNHPVCQYRTKAVREE